jgi:phage gp45-like
MTVSRAARKGRKRTGAMPVVGVLQSVSPEGITLVDYPGNEGEPMPARVVGEWQNLPVGSAVFLMFEGGDPDRPVIVGPLGNAIRPGQSLVNLNRWNGDAILDGRRVVLEARQEIVLQCGKGSITVRADGRIVIKGTEVVSRSSGANKIKGALVNIN